MNQRAEYGSLRELSVTDYNKHKAEISKQWRQDNPEKVKQYNKDWYAFHKAHPHCECRCKICGKKFKSYRANAKICPKCLESRKK